jgi:putative transcriptional regulator
MYNYTECGLRNVWLKNGYVIHNTPYGEGVSIQDVEGLHELIGRKLATLPKLTGTELRFLRKEMGMSQRALSELLGTSEQNISLWERRGRMPKVSDRLIRLIYLEHLDGNVHVRRIIENLNELDASKAETLQFEKNSEQWKEAA